MEASLLVKNIIDNTLRFCQRIVTVMENDVILAF